MSQRVQIVTCYVCRRKRRGADPRRDEIFYEVWLHVEVRSEGEAVLFPELVLDTALDCGSAERLREELKEALAEELADSVEDMVWKTADDLSKQQIADIVANLPDGMKALVGKPLENLAMSTGVSPPVARLGGDVAATLVLRPVLEPVEKTVHCLEVIGVVVGLVTGLHPLAIVCAKHLAHDELGSLMAAGFEQLMKAPEAQELSKKLSAVDSPADQTHASMESSLDRANADHESVELQKKVLPTVCGRRGPGENVMEGIGTVHSKTAMEILKGAEIAMKESNSTSTTDLEHVTTIRAISALGL